MAMFHRTVMAVPRDAYMFWWADFNALAATPMILRTSVLVLAFSKASLWNSMVERVPSICWSCFSHRFFRFKAWIAAAVQGETHFRPCYRRSNGKKSSKTSVKQIQFRIINQSINQSTNQATKQPSNQSINQSTNQSIKPMIDRL